MMDILFVFYTSHSKISNKKDLNFLKTVSKELSRLFSRVNLLTITTELPVKYRCTTFYLIKRFVNVNLIIYKSFLFYTFFSNVR